MNSKIPSFKITVIGQDWLASSDSEEDLCSHGQIELVIGGEAITRIADEYGISTSALALLRTLQSDHTRDKPVADRLIMHGCAQLLLMGCPIGVNWEILHFGDAIQLSNVVRFDTTNEQEFISFPAADTTMPFAEYRGEVISFAESAKAFFAGVPKVFHDDLDRQEYEEFWGEFDRLLQQNNK